MPAPPARASNDGDDLADPLADKLVLAGRGDEGAFADVYDGAAPHVFGLVLRVTGDPHRAEQVAQGAFVDIWSEAPRFDRTQGSAMAWMMSLAHRRAVECVRSARAASRHDGSQDGEARAPLESLPGLTGPQQRAVELAYLDGYTYVDVSGLMRERSADTLSQMCTALRILCPQP